MNPTRPDPTSPSGSLWRWPRVVAHRGGGTLAPENTLAAFDVGARYGHRMVEFDVKLSADDVAFLLHDPDVARTSDGAGAAVDLRYDEIAAFDAGNWFDPRFAGARMPTLAEVAACCRAHNLAANIEIKPSPGTERETGRRVAELTTQLWADHPATPLFSSFSFDALAAARDAAPLIPRGLLASELPADWRELAAQLQCVALHLNHRRLTAPLVQQIKDAGLCVFAYTVNEPDRALELANWGVDAICTDRIDLIGTDFLK